MGRSFSLVNIVTMVVCVAITVVCFLRLATAAIALACLGDKLGEDGGCNDDAITEAAAEGLIRRARPVFEYIDGRVTGLPSGFFYQPR